MWRTTITTMFILAALLSVSTNLMGESSADPIVGCWQTLSAQIPGSPRDRIEARANGTLSLTLAGMTATGTWRRLANGRYFITPGREDEYVTLRGNVLSSYDREGLIQTYHRIRCR